MSYQWDSGFFKDLASGAYPGSQPQGGASGAVEQAQLKPLEVYSGAAQMAGASQSGGLLQTAFNDYGGLSQGFDQAAPMPKQPAYEAPQTSTNYGVDTGWLKGNAPAPSPAPQAGGGVTNYLYRYSDGTTGNSPHKLDANGNIILNSAGGIAEEGVFLGRTMEDGSINQSPLGNVTPDGRVHLYGGYTVSADDYYKPGQIDWFGNPINVGTRPSNGYGYGTLPQDGEQNFLKPLPVGPGGEIVSTRPERIGSGGSSGAVFGPGGEIISTRPTQIDLGKNPGAAFGSGGSGGVSSGQSGPNTGRQVDYATETVEGRIRSLLATDANGNYSNPLIQQAVNTTMQQFAGRGLLNSSMASEAAYQAAMAKAIEIAGPDAQTYFAQGRANQDAANVFERDARGYAQENARLDKQISVDMEKFNKDLQYRYDALKLDKSSQDDARALAQKYAIEMENIKAVNSAYDLYLRRISDIDANTEYDAETKMRLKNEAGKDFDLYAKAKGISQDMNLGGRFTQTSKAPDGKPSPAANTNPDYGQG